MTPHKCSSCGLVNFVDAIVCKRCGEPLSRAEVAHAVEDDCAVEESPRPTLLKRTLVVVLLTTMLLAGCYVSLLETSEPVNYDQKQLVLRAINLIESSGFERDAFLLRRLANYRTTDNWWNRWLGHGEAYAATNFPFQVITLYPEFFMYPTDDTERAVILLHEARHLSGSGEEVAFRTVWRDKARLGWTKERYAQTRVWHNVTDFTLRYAPALFQCGTDGQQDCTEPGQLVDNRL